MSTRLFFIFFISIVLTVAAGGQVTDDPAKITIPENINKEIVRRILNYQFKPAKCLKIISLARNGLDPDWLPKIANIRFKLLTEKEIEEKNTDVYFFTEPQLNDNFYNIVFAFGDPHCNYVGNNWSFRIINKKLKLWPAGDAGGGCGGSGSNFQLPGKLNKYPNELKSYNFFDQGKLKGLQLAVSTREEVKRNFGSDCDNSCDYNDDWQIHISYFGLSYREMIVDNKLVRYVPREKYRGRIYSFRLFPKRRVSFNRIVFPDKFSNYLSSVIGDGFVFGGGLKSAIGISYHNYSDRFGLKYQIFERVDYTHGETKKGNEQKGDLVSIEYTIPEKIEEIMFAAQK